MDSLKETKCDLYLQDSNYPWNQRVSFAKDIAAGMVSLQKFCSVML